MRRTTLLGGELLYKVGRLDAVADESGYFGGGSSSTASNILPLVANNPIDVILTPSVITYNNTSNSDASVQPSGTTAANVLTSDTPLTPVTTPTTETSTSAKINKNWWWALAAGALAYKLARHKVL